MSKIKEKIRGFFSCTNLIKHCILPKEVKKDLAESEKTIKRIDSELDKIRAARIEIERRYQRIEDQLTIDGDPEWYRAIEQGKDHHA